MAAVTPLPTRKPSVAVPASSLREFEPLLLGSLRPRFRRLSAEIQGRRQKEIRRILEEEAARDYVRVAGRDGIAYQAAVLVLRDYVACGYYPTVAGGRLFLAAVLDSPAFSQEQRRTAMTGLYRSARDRALVERGQVAWIERLAGSLRESAYDPNTSLRRLLDGPPVVVVRRAVDHAKPLDTRGLWRAVRATWSMGPEASAPGREVAYLISDVSSPVTPLGIIQFRNVVPEIRARDLWLGMSAGSADATSQGFLGRLAAETPADAREHLAATGDVFRKLLRNVQTEGIGGQQPRGEDVPRLLDIVKSRQARYKDDRRSGESGAHDHLSIIKRAETAVDLLRGLRAIEMMLDGADHPNQVAAQDEGVLRDLDAGLGKIWHYHMGFVALELSICGAAPPFGPARLGKLAAALAGSSEAVSGWGTDRPLGEIASKVYAPTVREDVPNPGPLVIFTSGLFPGHSAQYNRVSSGKQRWRKIGETTGFGSFHIGVDTTRALNVLNEAIDGYTHVSRRFGEGSGPRFRAVGRALASLGLPDLRKHETKRPLYALPLVDDPGAILLGWRDRPDSPLPKSQDIASDWWQRWFSARGPELVRACSESPDLQEELENLARGVGR